MSLGTIKEDSQILKRVGDMLRHGETNEAYKLMEQAFGPISTEALKKAISYGISPEKLGEFLSQMQQKVEKFEQRIKDKKLAKVLEQEIENQKPEKETTNTFDYSSYEKERHRKKAEYLHAKLEKEMKEKMEKSQKKLNKALEKLDKKEGKISGKQGKLDEKEAKLNEQLNKETDAKKREKIEKKLQKLADDKRKLEDERKKLELLKKDEKEKHEETKKEANRIMQTQKTMSLQMMQTKSRER